MIYQTINNLFDPITVSYAVATIIIFYLLQEGYLGKLKKNI